jgi:hypothetical protein
MSAPAKPRAAVRVNPVTGKMEAVDDAADGMKRDGCMRLPAKYLTAALDAGLGGANGRWFVWWLQKRIPSQC